jgi:hypothetical protein
MPLSREEPPLSDLFFEGEAFLFKEGACGRFAERGQLRCEREISWQSAAPFRQHSMIWLDLPP